MPPSVSSVTSCANHSGSEQEATEGTEVGVPIGSDALKGILGSTDVQPARRSRFGDYELLEEIAHGGMGVVYRARQVSLKRIVAVKMLLFGQFAGKAAFDRFRAEAETAARLQHPNIVAVHEIGETDGQPYFSMDYVAGRNLAELVRDRPLPARQAAGYVQTIAQAVQYAHVHGVLHRDLKPANVLIDEFDEPRVTDFGLARQLDGRLRVDLDRPGARFAELHATRTRSWKAGPGRPGERHLWSGRIALLPVDGASTVRG